MLSYVNAFTQMEGMVSLNTIEEKINPEQHIHKTPKQIFEWFSSHVTLLKDLSANKGQINYLTMFYVYLSISFECSDMLTR